MKINRISTACCVVATFVWIFAMPIAKVTADYSGKYCAQGEIPNPNGGIDDQCHCAQMTVFDRRTSCKSWHEPDSTCSESLRSNGTTYSPEELSPERSTGAFAGLVAACMAGGGLCAACLAIVGGGTGGVGVGVCTAACAGMGGGCVSLFTECAGYHCNIVGMGTPSQGQVLGCGTPQN